MKEKSLKKRIKEGQIQRDDVVRRLAELAFGRANDCIKLVMSSDPPMDKLDLSLLSEVKRSTGTETFTECSWISIQLENTATGLRQVRKGVAKSRGVIVLG